MIKRIGYWLGSPEALHDRLQAIADFQQKPDKFQFYLYRFLLSQDLIDFETFYRLGRDYVKPQGDFWCLSMAESVVRRKDFDRDNHYGIWVFPGLKHHIGWIGCGLSYKFMTRVAEDLNLPQVTICEDDVLFYENFSNRYFEIRNALIQTEQKWDIFSGLISDLSKDAQISESKVRSASEHFYDIDRLISMVFNVYNQSSYSKVYGWDDTYRPINSLHNTIDRYIQDCGKFNGLVVSPFLVGHKEDLDSTLWGHSNTAYNDMISRSQKALNEKIASLNK